MTYTTSERYIRALQQLPQFACVQPGDIEGLRAVHVLTGAQVFSIPDPDELDHGLISIKFNGGHAVQVIGAMYLELQIAEAQTHYQNAPTEEGSGSISKAGRGLLEHLVRKHELE